MREQTPDWSNTMAKFLVERYLPGMSQERVAMAAGRAKETTLMMRERGTAITYLRSMFVPDEEKCYCLFEGPSVDAVRTANMRAALPFERIVAAQDIAAEDLG